MKRRVGSTLKKVYSRKQATVFVFSLNLGTVQFLSLQTLRLPSWGQRVSWTRTRSLTGFPLEFSELCLTKRISWVTSAAAKNLTCRGGQVLHLHFRTNGDDFPAKTGKNEFPLWPLKKHWFKISMGQDHSTETDTNSFLGCNPLSVIIKRKNKSTMPEVSNLILLAPWLF